MVSRFGRCVGLFALVSLLSLAGNAAEAGVTVGIDTATLNELLPELTMDSVRVPISNGRSIEVWLEDLEVTGLEPARADDEAGVILTSLTVKVPSFGIAIDLDPKLALHVVEEEGMSILVLNFDEVAVPLPIGSIDIARFVPPVRFPADSVLLMAGADNADVFVRTRLTDIKMGQKVIRFELELESVPGP